MGLSARQVRLHVVRPTLEMLGLWSAAAENLVLGTAAHESGGFQFIDQVTGPTDETLGPALGLFQIEPTTHDDLHENFLSARPALAQRLAALVAPTPSLHQQLVTNLCYATAVCRLIYYRSPQPLPHADDIEALGRFWKTVFNTVKGKGTVSKFVWDYRCFVK